MRYKRKEGSKEARKEGRTDGRTEAGKQAGKVTVLLQVARLKLTPAAVLRNEI